MRKIRILLLCLAAGVTTAPAATIICGGDTIEMSRDTIRVAGEPFAVLDRRGWKNRDTGGEFRQRADWWCVNGDLDEHRLTVWRRNILYGPVKSRMETCEFKRRDRR